MWELLHLTPEGVGEGLHTQVSISLRGKALSSPIFAFLIQEEANRVLSIVGYEKFAGI